MVRTLIIGCMFLIVGTGVATSQEARSDSKRILGEWSGNHSGADRIFHADGSWGVQRDHETIQGRWWLKGKKLFLTYPEDNGVGTPVHIRTAEYKITFVSDNRFTTETGGHKEIYDRVR
jgi:hypothetical protein